MHMQSVSDNWVIGANMIRQMLLLPPGMCEEAKSRCVHASPPPELVAKLNFFSPKLANLQS